MRVRSESGGIVGGLMAGGGAMGDRNGKSDCNCRHGDVVDVVVHVSEGRRGEV